MVEKSHAMETPRYFSAQVLQARRFQLRAPAAGEAGIHVLSGGMERCRPDYEIKRAGFPRPFMEFVAGGAGRLVLGGRRHALLPGTVFVCGRGVPHRIISDRERPLVKYFVVLAGRDLSVQLRASGLGPGLVARVLQPDRVRQLFEDLIDFGLGNRPDREACCAQAVRYLLLKTASLIAPANVSAARAFATYERCRAYIEAHGLESATLREIAAACHVDAAYLSRLFKRFAREQPHQYIQHLRMNRAVDALQTTDRMIKDIAAELGFSDAANFTRSFRKWFGVPPHAMR